MSAPRRPESEPNARARRRRWPWWLLATAAIAVLFAVVWGMGTGPDAPRAARETPAVSLPPVSAAPVAVAGSAGAPPPPPGDPIADFKARTRYAPTSGRLGAESVDLLEPNRRYEQPRPIQATLDRGPAGVLTYQLVTDRYYYWSDDVVTLRLEVRRGGEPVPVTVRRAVAVAEGRAGAEGDEETIAFVRRGGDAEADLRLGRLFPDHHGPVLVSVDFEYEPGQTEETSLRLFSTPVDSIPAAFTGRYDDRIEGGHLVVEVGLDVFEPGFYRIDGNLFGPEGLPVAFAHWKGPLERGGRRVRLEFFGLMLRDAGVAGPYELRHVRGYLFRDGAFPDRVPMRDAERGHLTRGYELAAFSEDEYTSPHKERMLELLEADVAAGIGVDLPPAP